MGTCSAWRREEDRDLNTLYSGLVGSDGEDVVERSSAQRKDSKQQGDMRAGEIPPGHMKRKVHHRGGEALQQGPSELMGMFLDIFKT